MIKGESIDSSRFHIETQEGDYYLKAMSHEEGERLAEFQCILK